MYWRIACGKVITVNLFRYVPVDLDVVLILKTCHRQFIKDSPNLSQVLYRAKSEVGRSCEPFWPHMQSREGSCSEVSRLRNEDLVPMASFIISDQINPGVC
jgi:hypothetical protein